MKMKYFIITSGYNCSSNVRECYNSLISLKGDYNWSAILIDDGSEDNGKTTNELLKLKEHPSIKIKHYKENKGAAYRRFEAIKNENLNDEDVIILLGLDDRLMNNALIEIDRKYLAGAWMTYGNWKTPKGEKLTKDFLTFPKNVHINRDYRKVYYRSTAPNTFKKFLFDQFTEEDFKFKGEWIKATTESNLMFSCLEMCGERRIAMIEKPIYIYNKGRKDNAKRRFGSEYQDMIFADVISKPKRELIIK